MIHDPVEQDYDKYNSFLSLSKLRPDTSGTKILILVLYLAVQLDLHIVINWNRSEVCNVHSTIKECVRRINYLCHICNVNSEVVFKRSWSWPVQTMVW